MPGNPDCPVPDAAEDELRHDRTENVPVFDRASAESGKRHGLQHLSRLDADQGQAQGGPG